MITAFKVLLALACFLPLSGCKSKSPPAAKSADAAASTPAKKVKEAKLPPAPPIVPITAQKLKIDEAPKVIALANRAHYDPDHLGLKDLVFSAVLKMKNKKGKTEVHADCRWKGGAPDVELTRVMRDGKAIDKEKHELNKTIWTSLQFRARRVLNGIGRGFLRDRIEQFKTMAGKVTKLDGPKLQLVYDDKKAGKTTIVVGEGYRVESIKIESPLGVTRSATYEHLSVGGRNLVKKTVYNVAIDENSKAPRKAEVMLKAGNGAVTEISYAKVGRYHLPSKLVKHMPVVDDHMEVIFTHKRARP